MAMLSNSAAKVHKYLILLSTFLMYVCLTNVTGMEKKNDVAKILYHLKSNWWDFTTDLLQNDYIMHELRVCERQN